MAILLEFNYGKKLGLPGYSSHLPQGKQFWARTGQIFCLKNSIASRLAEARTRRDPRKGNAALAAE